MTRLLFVLLVLFVAVSAASVSAADNSKAKAEAPTTSTSGGVDGGAVEPPVDNTVIGTTDDGDVDGATGPSPDDDDVAVAGPIGSESSYSNYPNPETKSDGKRVAAALGGLSAITGFVAAAGSLFFL